MAVLRILTEEGVLRIHEATLGLLASTGVKVGESRARQILLRNGCRDLGSERLGIPRELVAETMLRPQAPMVLQGTDPGRSLTLDGSACYLQNFGSVSVVVDLDSGDLRDATYRDAVDMARLLDALPNCHHAGPLVLPVDMDPRRAKLAAAVATLLYTGKPVSLGAVSDARETELCVEMSRVVSSPGRPIGRISISPISPMTFPTDICEAIQVAAVSGLPLLGLPCPIRSMGAPLFLAGALLGQNAENLAFGVMARLLNPEVKLMHASRIGTPDMRTGSKAGADPDVGVAGACMAQMARHYGLPSNVYGMDTGALVSDAQAGLEKAANTLRPMLAGADQISGLGQLGGGLVASFVQAVVDDDIFSFLSHHLQALTVEPGTLDLAGFRRVVGEGESFMIQEATLEALNAGDVWTPGRISAPGSWDEWAVDGRKMAHDRARQFARDRLASDPVRYQDDHKEAALNAIVEAA